MKKLYTLLFAAVLPLMGMAQNVADLGDEGTIYYNANKINPLEFEDGAKIEYTAVTKTFDPGAVITYKGTEYSKGIKVSNGAQVKFTCPAGKKAYKVSLISYLNIDAPNRKAYWIELNGTTYTEDTCTELTKMKGDTADPDVTTFSIADGADSFTFQNKGEQCVVLILVDYAPSASVASVSAAAAAAPMVKAAKDGQVVIGAYNTLGQRVK